ncbi:MAG: hypothetical protein K0U84_01595 [Actinomycetia bacterium]|nr:hypothetical protein [Actinomycetes bacterium]
MAVKRIGVGYTASYLAGGDAAGSKSVTVNVGAGENTYGIVAYGIVGDSDIDGATLDVTWDSVAMTSLLTTPLLFDTDNSILTGWIIENPGSGSVTASYADLPFGLLTKNLFVAAVAVSSVEPLDLDTITSAVVTEEASGSVSTSGVTVASGVPADRVISAHLIGKLRAFSGFSGTKLAAPLLAGGGQLMLGESRGDASVDATATHTAASGNWAAWGLNLDALPIDGVGFSSAVTIPAGSFGADLYRFAEPHPDRYYVVPAAGTSDPNLIAGAATTRGANGVDMPVWQKDPDDTLEYTLRWSNHLADDDDIIRVEHRADGLQIFSELINPDMPAETQFWTRGATPGITHPVRIRFWTRRGRQHDFTAFIAGSN